MIKFGLQLWTMNNEIEKNGIKDVIIRCKNIGYNKFEICGADYVIKNCDKLVEIKKELDIEFISLHFNFELDSSNNVNGDYAELSSCCKRLGIKILTIGMMPLEYARDWQSYFDFAQVLEYYGNIFKNNGQKLYYHNHHFELIKFKNEMGLEVLLNNTNSIGFELDVHWLQRGGKIPQEIIKKYGHKTNMIHLKDYVIDSSYSQNKFADRIKFGALGAGSLELDDIIHTAVNAGVEYFFVEQDDTYGKDPYIEIEKSYEYLCEIGYKNNF